MSEQSENKGMMAGVGNAADHVVGDLFLGGIGRLGFQLSKVEPVRKTGAYVRDNIKDGFEAGKQSDFERRMAKEIASKTRSSEIKMKPQDFRKILERQGVPADALDRILAKAEARFKGEVVDEQDEEVAPAPAIAPVPA